MQVEAVDYPRPDIDGTVNYLEAAALSAYLGTAKRPEKPLKVVIAGAGMQVQFIEVTVVM